jgi:hypothetical protein
MTTIKELRKKAKICRDNAARKTGEAYHREMQKAHAYEAQANERQLELFGEPEPVLQT